MKHPTNVEWRRAVRRVREMRAEKRALAALAECRALLSDNRIRKPETEFGSAVSHGTDNDQLLPARPANEEWPPRRARRVSGQPRR